MNVAEIAIEKVLTTVAIVALFCFFLMWLFGREGLD